MFLYNPIGKTLQEVDEYYGFRPEEIYVFVLKDENDKVGALLCRHLSISLLLMKMNPKYWDYVVKYKGRLSGSMVFRVIEPKLFKEVKKKWRFRSK